MNNTEQTNRINLSYCPSRRLRYFTYYLLLVLVNWHLYWIGLLIAYWYSHRRFPLHFWFYFKYRLWPPLFDKLVQLHKLSLEPEWVDFVTTLADLKEAEKYYNLEMFLTLFDTNRTISSVMCIPCVAYPEPLAEKLYQETKKKLLG